MNCTRARLHDFDILHYFGEKIVIYGNNAQL
jgi:hypothetical protein